jgi:hypothetical protein
MHDSFQFEKMPQTARNRGETSGRSDHVAGGHVDFLRK